MLERSVDSKALPIRLVVGGPPNSGKSTFARSLAMAFQDQGLGAETAELDLWSPTQDYLMGKISKEERETKKRAKISMHEANVRAREFIRASDKYEVVIGDSPGELSTESDVILKEATHAIILCREDRVGDSKQWEDRFKTLGVPVIGILTSSRTSPESANSNGYVQGIIADLGRKPQPTANIRAIATLLRSKLQI
jgi:hypothetical protein